MSKPAAPRKVGDKEALAVGNTIRGSARKLNLVATMIRGRKVEEALNILKFSPKAMADDVRKVLLPLMNREIPVITDEIAKPELGTGVVKVTPAHDANDFQAGLRHNLPQIEVMDEHGVMNQEAGPYAGKDILAANPQIVADLAASGHLLSDPKATLLHSYPHCWRCHNPAVFRATDQWFLSL